VSQRDVDQWNAGHDGEVGQSDGFDVGRAGSSTATGHFVWGRRRRNVCGAQRMAGSPEGHVQCSDSFPALVATWSDVRKIPGALSIVARRRLRIKGIDAFMKPRDKELRVQQ